MGEAEVEALVDRRDLELVTGAAADGLRCSRKHKEPQPLLQAYLSGLQQWLREALAGYLALRRSLGFKLERDATSRLVDGRATDRK